MVLVLTVAYFGDINKQKEFELLKYQILGRNNSRKGLEKMKRYVEKYLRENKIDKDDANNLLQYISQILTISS